MNINKMKKSKYLIKEDVDPEVTGTIVGIKEVNLAQDGQPEEMEWAMKFKELEKPMVLNWTNTQLIAQALGSIETDDWIGKQVVLYHDKTVSFGGRVVGGIRVKAAATTAAPADAPFDDDIPW